MCLGGGGRNDASEFGYHRVLHRVPTVDFTDPFVCT